MPRVFLSLGSNIDRYGHVSAALDALQASFGELLISRVYESEAVGFDGDNFLNLVVGIETSLDLEGLTSALKAIEDDNGRQRNRPRFSARTLDIDVLVHADADDGESLRDEAALNAFVLRPLADVAPAAIDPMTRDSYSKLWREYSGPQKLWPVDFRWTGRLISRKD